MGESEPRSKESRWSAFGGPALIPALGLFGLYFVVIRSLGPNWSLTPGDLGDARFNNYVLEHFFRWISGLDAHYWTAPFFYPFPYTIAFSDNLLGSAPIYAAFRFLGLNRESAFQAWFVTGYALNYAAAAYVLSRLRFGPFAAGMAAFFFAFGLPMLALETYVQLVYRFAVPIACLCLWEMVASPRLPALVGAVFWFVWQFYLGIYTGVFLSLLLAALVLIAPLLQEPRSIRGLFAFWPGHLREAWQAATPVKRLLAVLALGALGVLLAALIRPYWDVNRLYGFRRDWGFVARMLLTWQTYLVSDRAQLWAPISRLIPLAERSNEHEQFPGLAATIIGGLGIVWLIWRRDLGKRSLILLHTLAGAALVVLTLQVHGFSLYWLLWRLPGTNSIRAPGRIILVIMWPLAVLIASGLDQLARRANSKFILRFGVAVVLSSLLVAESVLFIHYAYPKTDSLVRLSALRAQIPAAHPTQPILVVADQPGDRWFFTEVDAMLVGQDLGWPVLNGYSGNSPPAYGPTLTCSVIPWRIMVYMESDRITAPIYYLDIMKRVVPIGFDDCDPSWWVRMPRNSSSPGSLSQETVSGMRVSVTWVHGGPGRTRAQVEVTNDSAELIPAGSSSGNPFEISWSLVGDPGTTAAAGAAGLEFDIRPHAAALVTFDITPPSQPGTYQLEVTALQRNLPWPVEWGVPAATYEKPIVVDGQGNMTVGAEDAP